MFTLLRLIRSNASNLLRHLSLVVITYQSKRAKFFWIALNEAASWKASETRRQSRRRCLNFFLLLFEEISWKKVICYSCICCHKSILSYRIITQKTIQVPFYRILLFGYLIMVAELFKIEMCQLLLGHFVRNDVIIWCNRATSIDNPFFGWLANIF